MKKYIVTLVIAAMMVTMCACGSDEEAAPAQAPAETAEAPVEEKSEETSVAVVEEEPKEEEKEEAEEAEEEPIPEPSEATPEEIYAQVLDAYYADIINEFPIDNYFPMTLGTFETTIGSTATNALDGIGYTMKDISGDGTPELLIMKVAERDESSYHGDNILALYTIVENEPTFLAGGWARNRYHLLKDGGIYNEGSSGADDSSFDIYALMETSTRLELLESSTSQSPNYAEKWEELNALIEMVEISPFSEYETTADYPESAKVFWSRVLVDPKEKTFAYIGNNSFKADSSDNAMDVVFFTPTEVSDFKFNALTFVSSDDDGNVTFTEEELYSLDSLVMDNAVTITLRFVGDIPNYGISYVDAAGNLRRYALGESGFDGSLYLTEYSVAQ